MKILSLGLSGPAEEIRNRLQQDCQTIGLEGFRIAIDETIKGHFTFLGCNIAEGELSFRNYERVKNMLKACVARSLAEMIIAREEKTLVRKMISQDYGYFSEAEQGVIYDNAMKLLDSGSVYSDFGYAVRRDQVLAKLQEYLAVHQEIVIEGFIAFRLKDYRDRLAEIVGKAVDEYMMDLEYKEFIRVLRYFVDVQEAQVDEVHVVVSDDDAFKISDASGNTISNQYLETFTARSGEEINYEDLLISALITIAPQTIMLHLAAAPPLSNIFQTIQGIFAGRVILCHGCDICQGAGLERKTPDTERN